MISTLLNLFNLIGNNYKRKFYKLLIIVFFSMIAEVLSLGLLIPLLGFLLDGSANLNSLDIGGVSLTKPKNFETFVLGFVTVLFLCKTFFVHYSIRKQAYFSASFMYDLSSKLYNGYISMSYPSFIKKNTATIIRNVERETGAVYMLVQSIITIASEIILLILLGCILIYFSPAGVFTFGLLFLLFHLMFYKKLKTTQRKLGMKRQSIVTQVIKLQIESLKQIKQIKIQDQKSIFSNLFSKINKEKLNVEADFTIYQGIPRIYLELFMVLGMLTFVFVQTIILSLDISKILVTLSSLAIGAFKALPSYNKIIISLNSMNYNSKALSEVYNELTRIEDEQNEFKNETVLMAPSISNIKIENGYFKYPQKEIVRNLNIEFLKENIYGIVGESGQGKTTLLELFAGLQKFDSGKIFVNGLKIDRKDYSLFGRAGYVAQENFFFETTLAENVAVGIDPKFIEEKKVKDCLRRVNLSSLVENDKGIWIDIIENAQNLSGGQRQRLAIARVLYQEPEIIFFDEPTSALDSETELEIMNLIFSLRTDRIIFIISHREETLIHADQILSVRNGGVIL